MNDAPTRMQLTAWLLRHTRRLLGPLVVSVLARIANQLLGVALLVVFATALGAAASGGPVETSALIAWLVGLALAKAGLRYLEHFSGHWVAFTALQRLRELFFARLVPQAPAATAGRAGAELTARATRDIDRVEVFFAHTMPPAVSAVVVPVVALTWLGFAVDAVLAAVIAPLVAGMLLAPLVSGRATWRAASGVARGRGEVAAHVGDDVQGVREVLAFGAERARLDALDHAGRDLTTAVGAAGRVRAGRAVVVTLLQLATVIVPLTVGLATDVPAASVAIALAVAVGLWVPARGIEGFTAGLDASFAAAGRVREIVEGTPAVVDRVGAGSAATITVTDATNAAASAAAPHPSPAPAPSASIHLHDVVARYPGADRPALDGVTARFEPGAWSVVVGVSGSGKSTLATLLVRGYDPERGAIRLGGADLRELGLDDLRRRVALVSQHPVAVSGTIADNLRLAAPDATDEALREAVDLVGLADWIASLPQGFETPVRERGRSVSGGQLQRLALARALVADPEVLVLDEGLSQLDATTAALVRDRLVARRLGLTVVEITHRADLVPDDAAVVVLDGGRVIEQGPAGILRASGGAFARVEARN
ncbi:ABC transporter ATP-binding protein [Agromyces sp. LHK192]|uniref:ABC transporter ATP-binding protein n=1 Tax=Agromyces sp. LHK192 TaxID=2498704 RepID=UPI000FD9380B|nr:ABC transporter ATP-binding protein [Agromyces sp. LHK192]